MNIYDFDNTIFKGDSSVKFIKYSLLRHPYIVTRSLLKVLKCLLKEKALNLTLVKSELFNFVKDIDNLEKYINTFVNKNMKNIKEFYLNNQKENDTIISASPDFLINSFCQKININNVIATKYDVKKGEIIGKNCKGEEKIRRFQKEYRDAVVNCAYSDSYSDLPMFNIAREAYLVKKNKLIRYK